MLVVIDANVLVSAAIQRGASHRIVESWLSGAADFEVVMCPELLSEVRDEVQTQTRDRNDDYLIALARLNDADVIVSGDKDLLEWESQRPPMMTPSQFESRGSAR